MRQNRKIIDQISGIRIISQGRKPNHSSTLSLVKSLLYKVLSLPHLGVVHAYTQRKMLLFSDNW